MNALEGKKMTDTVLMYKAVRNKIIKNDNKNYQK